jgi:hypothetical protein
MSNTMRAAALALGALLMLAASCASNAPTLPPGDVTIFTGPKFWTGLTERPWADAIAVKQGRVVALLDAADAARFAGQGVEVRRLSGRLATPGLVDAHAHIHGFGALEQQADLLGAESVDEALDRVSRFAARRGGDGWVIGRGWDQNDWPGGEWPTADELERAVPGRPCALSRIDGHALWVNRTALERAGIGPGTPDPPGGRILRDEYGMATGILIDEADRLIREHVPEPTDAQIEQALELAAEELMAVGLTGVHDMGMEQNVWSAMVRLARQGRFPLRVHAYAVAGDPLAERVIAEGPIQEGRLEVLGVKVWADGALGSRGARLLEPYDDQPGTRGVWVTRPEDMERTVRRTAEAGLQPAVHAIGDAANRAVLDAYERIYADLGAPPRPPRLEHAQILTPEDLPRLASLGVVASMQPTHATSDMPWVARRLGEGRLEGGYAWRTLLEDGAILAFGSDFPVESSDPRKGLYAAITRQDLEGHPPGGWRPSERLSPEQALAAFTRGAARAVGEADELGRIAPGSWCDVTVFERDWLDGGRAESVVDAGVRSVIVGGEVYSSSSNGG